jgi:hypothetical protein
MGLFKFGPHDVFQNRVKAHPYSQFIVHSGSTYYNNRPAVSGAFANNVLLIPTGSISLYELNVDRDKTAHDYNVDPFTGNGTGTKTLIYPFLVKDSHRISWKSVTTPEFDAFAFGDLLTGSYPRSASLGREYYPDDKPRYVKPTGDNFGTVYTSGSVTTLAALRNVFSYYGYSSPHYAHSSSAGGGAKRTGWDRDYQTCNLLSIPTIFYGSSLERTSVNLKFYITGTLVGHLKDRRNGELVQVGPYGSRGSGSIAGVVLYSEGFILLTGSWDMTADDKAHTETYDGIGSSSPKWVHFGTTGSASDKVVSSSFELSFNGTNYVSVLTMLAHAKKGELNHSNNPTYIEYGQSSSTPAICGESTGSTMYKQGDQIKIKNIRKTPYLDPTGSFQKITYISKIAIYDEEKNVIAVAKLATPVKKTVEKDYTFKLKVDF